MIYMTDKELFNELSYKRKNVYENLSEQEYKEMFELCDEYREFLDEGKTERECVEKSIKMAELHGFKNINSVKQLKAGDKVYKINRNKNILLAVIGSEDIKNGVNLVGAHIDSPRLDLKQNPLYESNDMALLKTHYYGGIKKYQWTAIPLSMHGKIVRRDGSELTVSVGEKAGEPQFCITDILPHLGKDQMAKKLGEAFTGEDLNILAGSLPVGDEKGEQLFKLNVMKILNEQYGIVEEDLISAELEFVPAFPAADIGFDRSMVGAYGHDDRVCAYPALEAILDCEVPEQTVITVLADKEEIGSVGNTGLASEYLDYFVADLAAQDGEEARHVLSKSNCLSADVSAAYDPNYAYAFEANNSTYLNRGIGISKYTGSRGKGGSNDASAEFLGWVRRIFDDNDVVWQIGELGKVDQGGGGTVALEVARLNADVIDVGVPVLSMHSPFEVVSKLDVYMAYKGFKAYFEA